MRPVRSLLMIVPAKGSVGVSMDPHLTEIERRPDRGVLLTAYAARAGDHSGGALWPVRGLGAGDHLSGALWLLRWHRAGNHFGGALWRGHGVALHRPAVDAQRVGNAANRPAFGDQDLDGLLLGHFEDVGHAPRAKHPGGALWEAVSHPQVVHFES